MSTTANTARAHKADAQKAGQTAIEEAVASRPFGHSLSDLPARLVIPHLAKWHRVVGIGDSVDEGMWDGIDPTVDWRRFENQQEAATTPFFGWGDRLAGHLSRRRADAGLSPVLYANLAVRGKLIDYIVSTEVPEALDLHPDLVLMDGGGNDVLRPGVSISRVLRYIEYGVRRIRRTGADVIFLLAAQPGERLEFARKKMADYNVRVKSLADELDFYVVDTWAYTPMSDPRLWSQDGIHPSSEGHERIAQMALVGLGLDPDPAWAGGELSRPLPGRLVTRTDKMSTSRLREVRAVPWVGRRSTARARATGVTRASPDLIVMPPAPHPARRSCRGALRHRTLTAQARRAGCRTRRSARCMRRRTSWRRCVRGSSTRARRWASSESRRNRRQTGRQIQMAMRRRPARRRSGNHRPTDHHPRSRNESSVVRFFSRFLRCPA